MSIDHIVRRYSAGDIIDQRTDFITRFNNKTFCDLMIGIMAAANGDKLSTQVRRNVEHVPPLVQRHALHAESYRVSADMVTLIEHAAAQLDDTDRFTPDTLPSRCGFVRFDRPLVLTDIRGNGMLIHVMTWGPVMIKSRIDDDDSYVSTMITLWNDIETEADPYAQHVIREFGHTKIRNIMGRWSFIGAETMTEGMRIGPAMIDPIKVGATMPDAQPFTNVFRYMIAFLLILDQTVTTKEYERPNIYARRRAKQRKIRYSDVTVISLRQSPRKRQDDDSGTRREVDWHIRWVVRGHWRWQPFGPKRSQLKRIWVAGYVKGPEDKPLVINHKLYDVK